MIRGGADDSIRFSIAHVATKVRGRQGPEGCNRSRQPTPSAPTTSSSSSVDSNFLSRLQLTSEERRQETADRKNKLHKENLCARPSNLPGQHWSSRGTQMLSWRRNDRKRRCRRLERRRRLHTWRRRGRNPTSNKMSAISVKAHLRRANEEVKATKRDKARSSMAVRRLNPDVKASERDKARDKERDKARDCRLDPDVKASERDSARPSPGSGCQGF
jgi:hypothetical protein